jgi:hypothetical protein
MRLPSRRVLAFGAIWAAISGGALLAPGCYPDNCVGGVEVFGADAGQGMMIDENTWASGPIDGDWLWFPRQHLFFFEIASLGGRTPQVVTPYISAVPSPNKTPGDFVVGAGNIALISGVAPNHVAVKNDTCSDYYLRLVVQAPQQPPAVDAGAGDAASDANEAGP